jgi:hypothetical protein
MIERGDSMETMEVEFGQYPSGFTVFQGQPKSSLETAGFNSNDKTDWLNNDTGLTPKEKREKRKKEREAQKEADNNCKKS